MFLFLSGNLSFSFFHTNTSCKCWKDVNSITHGKKIILLIKLESFQLPRSVLSRLEISVVLMDVFVVSFKLNFFLGISSSLWKVRMTLAFLEGLSVLSNIYIYKKVKIFKIIKQKKLRGIADLPFGPMSFLSYINNPDKFLVSTRL